MRRKLATLEVWLDDEPMNSLSRFVPATKHGTIVVSTKGAPGVAPYESPDEMRAVLAHELGHFMGYALDVPEHNLAGSYHTQLLADLFGTLPEQVVAEEQAWDWAEQMLPVPPETRKKYLDTYNE